MFCNQCGTEIINNAKFCMSCGTQVIANETIEKEEKNNHQYPPSDILNVSVEDTKEFNTYFLLFLCGYILLQAFMFTIQMMSDNYFSSNFSLKQILVGVMFVIFVLNIPIFIAFFLKNKKAGKILAVVNVVIYFVLTIYDIYDRFIIGDEHLKGREGMLIIVSLALSFKLFDLIRQYQQLRTNA